LGLANHPELMTKQRAMVYMAFETEEERKKKVDKKNPVLKVRL
jgi:hypothetical protein